MHLGDGGAQVAAHLDQHRHDAVAVAIAQRDLVVQLATIDSIRQRFHLYRLGTQGAQQVLRDAPGHHCANHQRDCHGQEGQRLEVVGAVARQGRFGLGHFFFLVDKAVDAGQPLDEGRLGLAQHHIARAVDVAGAACFDNLFHQRHGACFVLLDLVEPGALFWHHLGFRLRHQGVHRPCRLLVIAIELVDQGDHAGHVGIGHQGDVAQGDGAVVHAATEVDCIALLDVIDLADVLQAAVDGVDLDDAQGGQGQHHGQDDAEADAQAGRDAEAGVIVFHGIP